ncbi:hypothetical protein CLAFUW4_03990 [Fulvia fulva]|uniref:Uncharacterized protein n=1 Tax=Passalora fulva TaxID=5499 RepID=A0A9Q8LF85_PASFU|nr:uncharacterized protein CLAFUR5_03955 [Fulvia fulva]KAK4627043.1 hypothetical protein CLAFUR4_03976 [Fulvia fulva]KAK4627981.1 hypothetical protein CLAFUR0_03977 [Fulvia fulva]UJO16309.1 hypothetical protein CLAFUR5_03955 [Fulvia fulva]WPV13196.1 hypothetical protein CLAFUW4_03990 [Fulvia fulva]WPV29017.1 hypothetical protein CLAFUW7_03979 [Fulvia fulva]
MAKKAKKAKKTTFLSLPRELRDIIYTLAFNGIATRRDIHGTEHGGLLRMEDPICAEALEICLHKQVQVVVVADFRPKVKGDIGTWLRRSCRCWWSWSASASI